MLKTQTILQKHRLRSTHQRVALYDALCACKSHPTAEELFQVVRDHTRRLSLATVYNTLEAFCQVGLARKLPTTNGICRYDGDISDHSHVRFRDTGEIRDVPQHIGQRLLDNLPGKVLQEIESEMGVCIEGLSIQLIVRTSSRAGCTESDCVGLG